MAEKLTKEAFIDAIKQMTVLELNELVKALEEEFGVTASAPVMMAAAAPAAAAEEKEEKTIFDLYIKSPGAKKINVIKILRQHNPDLGLKDAKAAVENANEPVLKDLPKDQAEKIKKEFEEAGATVELK